MKKVKVIVLAFMAMMLIVSCNKQENANESVSDQKFEETFISDQEEQVSSDIDIKEAVEEVNEPEINYVPTFEIVERDYLGKIARASVNDDNVNVRLLPSISSEKIGSVNKGTIVEILGYSNEKEIINGYEGYWLKIYFKDKPREYYGLYGWIYSQYVDVDPSVEVSKIKFLGYEKGKGLTIELDRNGEKIQSNVYISRMDNQSFYTFVWCDEIKDFFYSDPTGTFKWDPETNEISNITSMGSEIESGWCLISDDSKFFFQDFGTSPGARGLGVYDIETTKQLYSGSYYRDLEYDGKCITVVKVYNNQHYDEHGKKFKEETPLTEEQLEWKNQGGGVDVLVKYRFNLLTKETEFIGCEYILSQ